MLKGKKTYITAITAIIGALSAYLTGEVEAAEAIQLGVTELLALFIRSGIKDQAKEVADSVKPKQNPSPRGRYQGSQENYSY